jgi:hypothetical protein
MADTLPTLTSASLPRSRGRATARRLVQKTYPCGRAKRTLIAIFSQRLGRMPTKKLRGKTEARKPAPVRPR